MNFPTLSVSSNSLVFKEALPISKVFPSRPDNKEGLSSYFSSIALSMILLTSSIVSCSGINFILYTFGLIDFLSIDLSLISFSCSVSCFLLELIPKL